MAHERVPSLHCQLRDLLLGCYPCLFRRLPPCDAWAAVHCHRRL